MNTKKNDLNVGSKMTGKHFLDALVHVLWQILYQLLVPFMLWKKAIVRLAIQRREKSLSITKSTSKWPIISYYLKYLFEFVFDAAIFLSYLLAPIYAMIAFVVMLVECGSEGGTVEGCTGAAVLMFLMSLIFSYISPLIITIQRDLLQLIILLPKKILDWATKPAGFHLHHYNKDKK